MRYSVLLPAYEGMSYAAQVEAAQAAEELGFDAVFRPDHWLPLSGDLTRGVTDAWATLAGLARETSRVRLGTLVSPVTFRGPVEIAKVVATVDEMSGGRVELGLGAGWYDAEHDRFGLHYPAIPERFEMLEEQLAIVRSLWTQPTTDHEGRHYRLHDAICSRNPCNVRIRRSSSAGSAGPGASASPPSTPTSTTSMTSSPQPVVRCSTGSTERARRSAAIPAPWSGPCSPRGRSTEPRQRNGRAKRPTLPPASNGSTS